MSDEEKMMMQSKGAVSNRRKNEKDFIHYTNFLHWAYYYDLLF
jgi:hypothetical protein